MNKKITPRRLLKWSIIAFVLLMVRELTPLRGLGRTTSQFLTSPSDPRVHYEAGTDRIAETVAAALPQAISTIERLQYRPFSRPVEVYICAGEKSLASYGGPKSAGGFVFNGRLFLSNKPQNTRERLPRVLTHELSHLHLEQQLGMIRCNLNIPSWFKEGLAVLVSDGGGAETVSAAEAKNAIRQGRAFEPSLSGSVFFPKSGSSYNLPEHMWYRQSALLVQFLHEKDEARFRRFLLLLEDGGGFESSISEAYSNNFSTLFHEFKTGLGLIDPTEKKDR